MAVEPVPDEPAAVADADGERLLIVADYHAGIEAGLSRKGIELDSRAEDRRERLLDLCGATDPDRVVILGDLGHAIGAPAGPEWTEIEDLFDALSVPVTIVKGNHDGEIEDALADLDADLAITPSDGTRIGDLGFAHGHTWPSREVLGADVVCIGHEHPVVRLEDEVGGTRMERAWLRGPIDPTPFEERFGEDDGGEDDGDEGDDEVAIDGDLVVVPAFNELSGGTWINVPDQSFLAPFLPDGLASGEAYLLDGTRLGEYQDV